jgi:CxxC-x17-CxxC domain-containing protein
MAKVKKAKKSPLNIAGLIVQVQQQLTYLDKKIDGLIAQISARPPVVQPVQPAQSVQQPPPRPVQRFDRPSSQGESRQTNDFRERVLHKVICAECKKECEVPFRPTGDRPVYCRDCFGKRKASAPFNESADSRSRGGERNRERPPHRRESGEGSERSEHRRPYVKKTFVKKWKKRP